MFGPQGIRWCLVRKAHKTAELTGITEAFQFLIPLGISPTRITCVFCLRFTIATDVCLGAAQARTNVLRCQVLANTFSLACATSRLSSHLLCVLFTATVVMLGINVQISRLHSGLLAACPTTTLPNAGRTRGLILSLS